MLLLLTRGQQIQAIGQMQPTISFQLHWNRHTQYCRLLLLWKIELSNYQRQGDPQMLKYLPPRLLHKVCQSLLLTNQRGATKFMSISQYPHRLAQILFPFKPVYDRQSMFYYMDYQVIPISLAVDPLRIFVNNLAFCLN